MRIFAFILADTASDMERINTLLRAFYLSRLVCGILCIAFLLLTGFLFWNFKIWQIVRERTGLAQKKSISQMQELNAATGRLVKSSAAKIAEQEFPGQMTGDRKKTKRSRRTGEMRQSVSGEISQSDGMAQESATDQIPDTAVLSETPVPQYQGKFVLTVSQMIIHTEEQIGG